MQITFIAALLAPLSVAPGLVHVSAPAAPIQSNAGVGVSCVLAGAQSATSIVLANAGTAPLPAGTKVHWSLEGLAYQGDYTLTGALPAGQTVVGFQLPIVLGGSRKGPIPCRASVAQGRSP